MAAILPRTTPLPTSVQVCVAGTLRMWWWWVLVATTVAATPFTIFTLRNNCPGPIWPATLSGNGAAVLGGGGFILQPNSSTSFNAPPGWSGRFWARTGCVFDPAGSTGNCRTGNCGGDLGCTGGGDPPVSLVEFTLGGEQDFYDVSLVDGYNVAVGVTPTPAKTPGSRQKCVYAGCVVDLNDLCPAELRVAGETGQTVACRSACEAFGSAEYCCTGVHATPTTCSPTRYSRMFKRACPTAYSYAYDDASSTCTCPTGSDYLITFCPNPSS